ncbi:MAG: hypothetical protein ACR2FM_00930 [Candidatus Saccharimonadales bacterium]
MTRTDKPSIQNSAKSQQIAEPVLVPEEIKQRLIEPTRAVEKPKPHLTIVKASPKQLPVIKKVTEKPASILETVQTEPVPRKISVNQKLAVQKVNIPPERQVFNLSEVNPAVAENQIILTEAEVSPPIVQHNNDSEDIGILDESLIFEPLVEISSDDQTILESELESLEPVKSEVFEHEIVNEVASESAIIELFDETHQKLEELNHEQVPKLEELLQEAFAVLSQSEIVETSIEDSTPDEVRVTMEHPVVIEQQPETLEQLTVIVGEIFQTLGLEATRPQVKKVVRMLIERKEVLDQLIHQEPEDRGTHEVLQSVTAIISSLKAMLEPLHRILGRVVLSNGYNPAYSLSQATA